jgi:hypothetical protein
MDVNGMACSIELHLSRDALTDEAGDLRPVRWTGWDSRIGRYQGAVEGKALVQNRFFGILTTCASPVEARAAFPDLAAVVDAMTSVFRPLPGRRAMTRMHRSGNSKLRLYPPASPRAAFTNAQENL